MRYLFKPGAINDGVLKDCGRIIIFGNKIIVGRNNTEDHNYLLRAFAARYRLDPDLVINDAIRLYYKIVGKDVIICGVRKLDNEMIERSPKFYGTLISEEIR